MLRSRDGLATRERAGGPATGWRRVGQIVRVVLIALFVAFLVGFVIGTLIRRQLEEPVHYYGENARPACAGAPA